MKVQLRSVTIIAPGTTLNGQKKDLSIDNGIITAIDEPGGIVPDGWDVIEGENLHVSPGWFDLHVNFGEPGYEIREDLKSGTGAAAHGGFTGVLCMPSTLPAIDSKAGIEFIKSRTYGAIVDVIPAGAATVNCEGKELAELYDMWMSGAPAFTDDQHPIRNAGVMQRALLYCKDFGGRLMVVPNDKDISGKGQMHEGPTSTMLGLKGIPSIAESVMVGRDIKLLEYTGGAVHFSTVSTSESVELIRKARQKGLNVTADVAVHHLALTDEALHGFDTNLKVLPPLRSNADRNALIEGLNDGTLDAITTDHRPYDVEAKLKEFDLAEFGMAGLETGFGAVWGAVNGKLTLEQLITCIAIRPRELLGLNVPAIRTGEMANITVFDPTEKWTLSQNSLHSKSSNNPFLGKELYGRPVAIVNNGKHLMCKRTLTVR